MKKLSFTILIALSIVSCNTSVNLASDYGNRKDSQKEKPFLPDSFNIDINFIRPMKFTPRHVSDFSMNIKNDSVFMYLPYEGELHFAPLGGTSLNLSSKAMNMKREMNKKGAEIISFKMQKDSFFYEFRITAFNNNNVDIVLQPSNGDVCSYSGTWEPWDEKEK